MTHLMCVLFGHRWVPSAWLVCGASETEDMCLRCYRQRFLRYYRRMRP